ncbi:MAG: membrane protein insertase YidC [Selenomonadaceae bacterium]|nr:membrane protein insertase YidC [Selenomonadaceae bacterium]MBR3723673.1 membrane protein insertase YidC [Selenomonadaceae bacterium]
MEPGIFGTILAPIEHVVTGSLAILHSITVTLGFMSYGWAIILLTILVKTALYPLTVKQIKSMKAMQELAPKMKAIQDKYKDKPREMQQKIGELYQKAGVNPFAGCLPLLIQMPILMGMYYALYNYKFEEGTEVFFWMQNLSVPDPLYILPLLSAVTTWYQQKQTATGDNPQMKIMMTIMPLFIGWISMQFPAGLVLYWVTMNIVQIVQQWWMSRIDDKSEEKKDEKKGKNKDN